MTGRVRPEAATLAPMWLLLQASESTRHATSYGASLVQAVAMLLGVCLLAWLVLRFVSQKGLGVGQGQRVKVLERVALDARRMIYVVQIGERVLVLGGGEGASPTLLAELKPGELPPLPPSRSFAEVLSAMRKPEEPKLTAPEPAEPEPTLSDSDAPSNP